MYLQGVDTGGICRTRAYVTEEVHETEALEDATYASSYDIHFMTNKSCLIITDLVKPAVARD